MDLMKWLKSLDELLFEIMSWLVFFPLTLWRALTRPLATMVYSDRELLDEGEEQYDDTMSPPIFLLAALLLSHAVELALNERSNAVLEKQGGLAGLINDDTTLLMVRMGVFALFPLLFATRAIRAQHLSLTRHSLRPPFFAQCYAASPFAFFFGMGASLAISKTSLGPTIGAPMMVGATLWFLGVQVAWYRKELAAGWIHAVASTIAVFSAGVLTIIAVAFALS